LDTFQKIGFGIGDLKEKFSIQERLPESAKNLSGNQKKLLQKIVQKLDDEREAEQLQFKMYEWGKELGLDGKETFSAIYQALIGKDHGPKAAWLILSLDPSFVKQRFEEAMQASQSHQESITEQIALTRLKKPEIFSIADSLGEKFPSISVGIAVIRGVTVSEKHEDLEKEKETIFHSLENLTTEQLGQYPEIISYRRMYKEMGVDWHSRRPSPEALLRRIALKKGLYSVNTCVDAYNLVVMKHRISIGAFDLDAVSFPTKLRFAQEGEKILLLGDTEPTAYMGKEVAYFDQQGGYNMDFNFRDAQRTAVKTQTKNLYINVDGVYDISAEMVEEVLRETCDIITKYCGGSIEMFGIVTAK